MVIDLSIYNHGVVGKFEKIYKEEKFAINVKRDYKI